MQALWENHIADCLFVWSYLLAYLMECLFCLRQDSHKITQSLIVSVWGSVRGKFNVDIKMKTLFGKSCKENLMPTAEADPGRATGVIVPHKTTKITLFTIFLYNPENSIHDIRPFCGSLFEIEPTKLTWLNPPLAYCCILLSGTRPKRRCTPIYSATMLLEVPLVPKPRCC